MWDEHDYALCGSAASTMISCIIFREFPVWVVSITKGRRLLLNNKIDVVAGQESWEKEDTTIHVEGYKWFGKPRISLRSQRGEAVSEGKYGGNKKDVFDFREKGEVVVHGDFDIVEI